MRVVERLDRLQGRSQTYGFLLGVVCTLLLAGLLVPFALGERDDSRLSAGDFGEVEDGGNAGSGFSTGSASDAGAVDGSVAAPGGSIVGSGAGGPPSAGATPPPGAGSAERPSNGGPTRSGPAAGGGVAPGSGAAPTGETRGAPDQGVTADSIKLGALVTDLGGTSALGFEPSGYSPAEQREYYEAHVRAINERGGIGGRKVEVVYETVDILDPESMRRACEVMGRDRKVFAVLHVLGVYGDPILCFTQQQKLPYFAWDGAVFDYYERSAGYLVTTQASTRRTSLDMARRLSEAGELTGKKVGILRYAEYLDADMVALIDYTRSRGVEVVDAVISVSNVGAVPSQLSVAVNRFQTEGVNSVFLMTNTLYAQQFVGQAERQGFLPNYAVSDFDYASAGNSFLSDMPDSFFRRGLLVTSTRIGDTSITQPEDRQCIAQASAFAGRPIGPGDEDFYDYLPTCGLLGLFERAVGIAGVNPTRATVVAAVPKIGAFPSVGFGPSSFAPGKLGGPDVVRVTQADLACRCWKTVDDFRPTGFRGA